ncbi:phosphonopyruvate decarboxylase [Paenibacillus chitinolyticus]|uniref:Phosphonopyruvate decarboxylase n=1 Tax=Paenibacillus chitinolyticus TaxID=79263 RepID=A0A410WYG7_9BACL|nr:phosphonopyruvate decarboxylase [Paenibacillus chitinolyticus]MCY9590508.1 phosphonopyruvate decarboxylase [Paenibacillus chitinolyticus]MCY9596497.1 phosphonopyruvate decarboxylase [Paenibacillus chitinolyticus]QAV19506.1 phosphonopyruvate decarboxylase [Paenibacillus chitinolyticus]
MDTKLLGEELKKLGYTFFSGVPCSFLKNLINYAINECDYVAAANEGDAVAIASGAYVGGKKSVVLMQNSGLTNAVSPLTSLNYPFLIPLLGFVSLRGEPGIPDEPQHELMGQITTQMLDLMDVEWQYLSKDFEEAKKQLIQADEHIARNRPFFFVVKKGTFDKVQLRNQQTSIHLNQIRQHAYADHQMPTRYDALSAINSVKDGNTVQLATTGKTGRELYEIEDADNNLYMVGSMGCISSLGLGLALSQPSKDIVVIDGDGSLLMRMGSLATNAYYHPANMIHILLDNNAHESTGGQSTVSHSIDFIDIAASCGYTNSVHVHSLEELQTFLQEWKVNKGLTFVLLKISKNSKDQLARPHMKPHEVKERLQRFIHNDPLKDKEVGGS